MYSLSTLTTFGPVFFAMALNFSIVEKSLQTYFLLFHSLLSLSIFFFFKVRKKLFAISIIIPYVILLYNINLHLGRSLR
ncbi:hypothetical protein NEOC84_000187|nr:hypothetical protein [Neochlamydia sp. AcF84]